MDYWVTYHEHYLNMNKKLDSKSYEKTNITAIERFLPSDKNAKLLDVGCGVGLLVYGLMKKGYMQVEGIDISKAQIDFAMANAPKKMKIYAADALEFLHNKSGLYDQIYLIDVVEHIKKKKLKEFLKPITQSLKPGGSIVIRTPNMANLFGIYSRYLDMTHETAFTEYSLIQIMTALGAKRYEFSKRSSADHWLRIIYSWFRDIILTCIFRLENRAVPLSYDMNLLMVFYF